MAEFTEPELRQIIRSEMEAFFLQTPPWVIDQLFQGLPAAVAKKLHGAIVTAASNGIAETIGTTLSEAVLAKFAATVDRAFLQAVSGAYAREFSAVIDHLERLNHLVEEQDRDNWWRRSDADDADDEGP